MNRRDFFKAMGAVGATSVAVAVTGVQAEQEQPQERPTPIPYVRPNDVVRASTFNAMIKAINELRDARYVKRA